MRLTLLLFSSVLLSAAASTKSQLSVWPVDSLVKVFPDDPPGRDRAPDTAWLIARNGHANVQFAIRSATAVDALGVSVKLNGGLETEVRRAGYVSVRSNPPGSPADEVARPAPAKFPDPLFEDMPFRLDADQTVPIWITVYAPAKTSPAVYKGEAVFRSGGKVLASVPLRIEVTRATVPAKQTLEVTNWFYLDPSQLGRYYDLSTNPDRYWDVLANIGRVLADHRQNA